MFQDWKGIPAKFVSESSIDWDFIVAWKSAKEEGMEEAFVAWVDYTGDCDFDAFNEAHSGGAKIEKDYAHEFVESCGLFDSVLQELRSYFDYEVYARDLFSSGYMFNDGFYILS